MKARKIISIILAVLAFAAISAFAQNKAYAGTWVDVGSSPASRGPAAPLPDGSGFVVAKYTSGEVFRYSGGSYTSLGVPYSGNADSMIVDLNNNIYVMYYNGVWKYNGSSWSNTGRIGSSGCYGIGGLTLHPDGTVWATDGDYVAYYNGSSWVSTLLTVPSGYDFFTIASDRNGNIYVGSNKPGYFYYKPNGGSWTQWSDFTCIFDGAISGTDGKAYFIGRYGELYQLYNGTRTLLGNVSGSLGNFNLLGATPDGAVFVRSFNDPNNNIYRYNPSNRAIELSLSGQMAGGGAVLPGGEVWISTNTSRTYKYVPTYSFSATSATQTSVSLSVSFDGNPLVNADLWYKKSGDATYTFCTTFSGTSVTVNSLTPGTLYYFKITHKCGGITVDMPSAMIVNRWTIPPPPSTPTATTGALTWSTSEGRGYVVLSWPAVSGATGYKIFVWDGNAYRSWDVGNVTTWDSRTARIYPSESWLDSQADNTVSSDPFNHVQGGLDLRDTPNKLYRKTVGSTYDSANNYWFGVSAYNSSGESPQSNAAQPTLPNRTDSAAPTISSLMLNNGDTKTSSNGVTVQVSASDPLVANYTSDTADDASGLYQLGLSNDNVTWTWVTYSASVNWNITSGPGQKTVYAKVKDNAGNVGETQSATIFLVDDVEGPQGTLLINNGDMTTDSTSVSLTLSVSDNFTQPSQIQMRFSNDGTSWSAWETFNASKSWTLSSGDGWKAVFCQLKDAQSNYSTISAHIALSTSSTAPSGTAAPSSPPPTVTFSGLSGVYSSRLQQATITASSLSNVRKVSYSLDGITWSPEEDVSGSSYDKQIAFTGSDGLKAVYVKFQNAYGKWSQPVAKYFLVDTTPPEIKQVSVRNRATAVSGSSVNLNVMVKDNFSQVTSDSSAPRIQYRYSVNGGSWSSYTAMTGPSITASGLVVGANDIGVQVKDSAGNESEVQYAQVFRVS
ncbi:MAG: hypothetical protein NUV48_07075 [Peptococcaceae bacterium]|jgi:hypothetical protein|nr:hypothetical protein [Peptococcaceae bacterium]